jgi:hypothetical protein
MSLRRPLVLLIKDNLEKLLAYRAQNRPSKHGQRFYDALVAYRMGEELGTIAERLGMTPYKSSPSEPGIEWGGTRECRKGRNYYAPALISVDNAPLCSLLSRWSHRGE